jgi:Undecaprenyl-phosphate glucose phosphotransferase
LAAVQAAYWFAWWLKFHSGWIPSSGALSTKVYFLWSVVYSLVCVAVGYSLALYSPKRKRTFAYECMKIVQTHAVSALVFLSLLFLMKEVHFSREFLLFFLAGSILCLSAYRFVVKIGLWRIRKKGYNKQFVLILGAGRLGKRFYENLRSRPELGFEVVGFLDDFQERHDPEYAHYKPIIGKIDELAQVLERHLIDEVILALPLYAHEKYGEIVAICEQAGVKLQIIPDFFDILPARPSFADFAGLPLINVRDVPLDDLRNRFFKRTFDIVFSLTAIVLTLPLMTLIALGIKLTSKGPVIFKQERVGLNRRTFMMYKFRTMIHQPAEISDTRWTTKNDPRRTKFGAFLRATSLDELPQFFNVLKGDMSVVGPRPERPYFVEQFREAIPKYMVKHHIRPGITGWAQSNGLRGDTSIEERIRHDLFYIENWSFLLDLKIICKTIVNGWINKNAY